MGVNELRAFLRAYDPNAPTDRPQSTPRPNPNPNPNPNPDPNPNPNPHPNPTPDRNPDPDPNEALGPQRLLLRLLAQQQHLLALRLSQFLRLPKMQAAVVHHSNPPLPLTLTLTSR